MYFHWCLGSQLLFYQFFFFLTILFCNGIAKITRQEEKILFILTIEYSLNQLKSIRFHYCTKPIDRNVKLGARAKRKVRIYFKHTAFLSDLAQGPGERQPPRGHCSPRMAQEKRPEDSNGVGERIFSLSS